MNKEFSKTGWKTKALEKLGKKKKEKKGHANFYV